MSRFECKTRLPVQMDPLRLQSTVLRGAPVLSSGLSVSVQPQLRSSTTDNLLKKHMELLNSGKTLGTFMSASFSASKRGGLSQRGAPPVKRAKNIETRVTAKHPKVPKGVEKSQNRLATRKDESFFTSKTVADNEDTLKEKFYSEVSYDNIFEKMEIEEKWEYNFGCNLLYNYEDDVSQCKKSIISLFNHTLVEPLDFRKKDLPFRDVFLSHLDELSQADPEFVLKLSLYGRKHLNIRSTSNFLVAFASMDDRCKRFLPKYYSAVVVLPSDWIEIAEFAMTLCKEDRMVLPSSLRRVMAKKFPEFDKYQLAKYNRDKTKNQKRRAKRKAKSAVAAEAPLAKQTKKETKNVWKSRKNWSEVFQSDKEPKEKNQKTDQEKMDDKRKKVEKEVAVDQSPHFTLKQLVRKLHISEPVDSIMELIGKKYPETMEAFFRSRLPGLFEEEKAGKRMKLPTPETWETQVSLKGNKAQVWEELLDHKKLPFMAMLRNLRNLILARVSDKHHDLVLGKLTNENAVINSKQFPFRFFSAYSVLDDLDKDPDKSRPKFNQAKRKRVQVVKKYKHPKKTALVKNLKPLLSRYRTALDKAVKIATTYNVPPIPGRTLIFCDVSNSVNNAKNCTSARGLGGNRSVGEMTVLLSMMCKHSCEESRLLVCGSNSFEEASVDRKSSILENTKRVLGLEGVLNSEGSGKFSYVGDFINKLIHNKEKIDRWIVMGGEDDKLIEVLSPKLDEFKRAVNRDVLAYQVDPSSPKMDAGRKDSSLGFIRLFGFTEQVLRYIAEESDKSQLIFVENIDRLYNLENPKHFVNPGIVPDLPLPLEDTSARAPKWTSCRIFISSTFLDMFSERDLLVKYIFQELRTRARSLFVDIFEVDLRWGLKEEQSQNNETIHLCLSEVAKCQFFVGMLGERYGWCPEDYGGLSSYPGLEWVEKHQRGASVTELEFHQCFRSLDVKSRAFFYFRDPQFLKDVPEKHKHLVVDQKDQKLKALKRFIVNSGAEVYNNYLCQWGGIDGEGKARVVDLEEFGKRVLDNLWNAIQKVYKERAEEQDLDSSFECDSYASPHLSYVDFLNSRFIGRQNLVNDFLELLASKKTGIIIITGKPGSGKSALMASVYKHWMQTDGKKKVLIHCVGASPESDDVVRMMLRFCRELEDLCQFSVRAGNDASFEFSSKVFQECLKCASSNGTLPIQIFIDGVDNFSDEHQARLVSWLPQNIPKGVLFVVSTNENSESHVALKNRPSLVATLEVGVLSLSDRQAIVREKLKCYSKTLDESAFNNQMKLISTKKESTSPLYLSLACEEMRQFGDFEKVNAKLASLPPTLSKLMHSFIEDLERTHGEVFVRTALCCLAYSKNGLKEHELQELLSRAFLVQSESQMENFKEECWRVLDPNEFVSPSSVLLFVRGAQSLLRPSPPDESGDAVMTIGHKEVLEAVRQKYTLNMAGKKYEKFIHTLLASYFYHVIDPNTDGNWSTADKRVVASFLYHLVLSCDFDLLGAVLTNLSFVQYCFKKGLSKELLEAYRVPVPTNAALKKDYETFIGSGRFNEYKSFVFKNALRLSQHPQLTFQQSLLEADDSCVSKDADEYLSGTPSYRMPYAKWSNKNHFEDLCVQSVDAKRSSCLALSSDEKLLAVGFETAIVKLYDASNFEVKLTLIGHSGCITSVCFVSNYRLCSSSKDETLSLWDISGGYRLAVMQGHRRAVTSCVSDDLGRIVVSVGLDALINVWHGMTGVLEATLPRDNRPINCLSLHPTCQSVVTGSWDSTLKIWDIIQKKKKAVLRGHSGSVQEVKFNRSGVHVASVDIFGEVRIWSAEHGSMVGFLKSPSDDLFTKIFYSPSGGELLTSSSNGTVKVLSSTMGRCINIFSDQGHTQATCVAFDPTPVTPMPDVVVGYHSGSARMFSCTSGDQLWECIHQGPPVAVTRLSFLVHSEKKFMVLGKADGTCQILTAKNGHPVSTLIGHSTPVVGIVASKDYLMTAGDGLINMHRLEGTMKQNVGTHHKPDFIVEGHKNLLTGIALSPNELLLASVGRDRSLVIWTVDSPLKMKNEFEEAHMDWITCCSWSDQPDYLVTGSNDFLAKVWDVKAGVVKHTLTGHNSMVTGVSFKYGCIVSSSADGCLKVWSHKGVYLSSLMAPHAKCNSCDLFVSLCEEEDSRTIYNNWDDEVTASKVRGESSDPRPEVKVIVVASCYDDGTTRIWNPVEADEKHLLVGHKDRVTALTAGHHGSVCTASADGLLKFWKVPSRGRERSHEGQTSSSAVCFLAVSPDRTVVCAGTTEGSLKFWLRAEFRASMDALENPKLSVRASTSRIACLHFLSETLVALTSDDLQLSLWQLQCKRNELSFSCLKSVKVDQPVTSMASLNDHGSSHLVTVHFRGCIQLWKIGTEGRVDIVLKDTKELPGLQFFGFHIPDEVELKSFLFGVKGYGVHDIELLENNSKLSVETLETVPSVFGIFTSFDFSDDIRFCGTASGHLEISKGSPEGSGDSSTDSSEVGQFRGQSDAKVHGNKITGVVAFNNVVVTCSTDGYVKVYDIMKERVVGQFETPFRITSMVKVDFDASRSPKVVCGTESGSVVCLEWVNVEGR